MLKKIQILLLILVSISNAQTELDVEKVRIYPSLVTQTEPVAAVHPLNNSILFVSAVTFNTSNAFRSEGVYVSTDNGMNWMGSDTCKGASMLNHGGDPGVVITESGRFILSHIGNIFPGMYSHYSTNLGSTWSNAATITNLVTGDKGTITYDNSTTSNFKGRVYLAWIDFENSYSAFSSYSSDEGTSWSVPVILNPNPPSDCVGGSVATDNNGNVYVVWSGKSEAAPFHEEFAGLAVSTNGGVSWLSQQNIFNMKGIAGTLPSKGGIRVNGLPQISVDKSNGSREGWLYIVTTEFDNPPAGGDPDIILRSSSDGGVTWSPGIRVNQDPINNGKIQYFPSLEIDENGGLNILFFDDRNTTSDSTDVFITRSTDGGNTWSEYSIKNSRFKPKPILGSASAYQGDRITLLSVEQNLYAFWMADYTGIYQVWMTNIDNSLLPVEDKTEIVPEKLYLSQNFPNPFNPATSITYSVPNLYENNSSTMLVQLKIFNVLGNEITTLVDEEKFAGIYNVEFSTISYPKLSSGIYFYRLQIGNYVETKKMVLLK